MDACQQIQRLMWQLTDIDQVMWMQKMKTSGLQVVDNEIRYVEIVAWRDLNEVVVNLLRANKQRMKDTLMVNLLQSVDGLEMINSGLIRSGGQIKFAKNSNPMYKVNSTQTKKNKIEQGHSMSVVDSRREIQYTTDCILEENIKFTKFSNL